MSDRAKAPRFQAYFQHVENRTILTWPREHWDEILAQPEKTVLVDITSTPMSRVASDAAVIACEAIKSTPSKGHISIWRYDPADGSTPYNKDHYQVLQGQTIQNRPDFMEMVLACNTTDNSNLRNYLNQHSFLIKDNPDPTDHWFCESELPASVRTVIKAG